MSDETPTIVFPPWLSDDTHIPRLGGAVGSAWSLPVASAHQRTAPGASSAPPASAALAPGQRDAPRAARYADEKLQSVALLKAPHQAVPRKADESTSEESLRRSAFGFLVEAVEKEFTFVYYANGWLSETYCFTAAVFLTLSTFARMDIWDDTLFLVFIAGSAVLNWVAFALFLALRRSYGIDSSRGRLSDENFLTDAVPSTDGLMQPTQEEDDRCHLRHEYAARREYVLALAHISVYVFGYCNVLYRCRPTDPLPCEARFHQVELFVLLPSLLTLSMCPLRATYVVPLTLVMLALYLGIKWIPSVDYFTSTDEYWTSFVLLLTETFVALAMRCVAELRARKLFEVYWKQRRSLLESQRIHAQTLRLSSAHIPAELLSVRGGRLSTVLAAASARGGVVDLIKDQPAFVCDVRCLGAVALLSVSSSTDMLRVYRALEECWDDVIDTFVVAAKHERGGLGSATQTATGIRVRRLHVMGDGLTMLGFPETAGLRACNDHDGDSSAATIRKPQHEKLATSYYAKQWLLLVASVLKATSDTLQVELSTEGDGLRSLTSWPTAVVAFGRVTMQVVLSTQSVTGSGQPVEECARLHQLGDASVLLFQTRPQRAAGGLATQSAADESVDLDSASGIVFMSEALFQQAVSDCDADADSASVAAAPSLIEVSSERLPNFSSQSSDFLCTRRIVVAGLTKPTTSGDQIDDREECESNTHHIPLLVLVANDRKLCADSSSGLGALAGFSQSAEHAPVGGSFSAGSSGTSFLRHAQSGSRSGVPVPAADAAIAGADESVVPLANPLSDEAVVSTDAADTTDAFHKSLERVRLVGKWAPHLNVSLQYVFSDPQTEIAYCQWMTQLEHVSHEVASLAVSTFCSCAAMVVVLWFHGDSAVRSQSFVDQSVPLYRLPMIWALSSLLCASSVLASLLLAGLGWTPRWVTEIAPIPKQHAQLAVIHVAQLLYLLCVFLSAEGTLPFTAQVAWQSAAVNWALQRPLLQSIWVMWSLDVVIFSAFFLYGVLFRHVSRFANTAYPLMSMAASLGFLVAREHSMREQFAMLQRVEILREEIEAEYKSFQEALEVVVPAGLVGRLLLWMRRSQKAQRLDALTSHGPTSIRILGGGLVTSRIERKGSRRNKELELVMDETPFVLIQCCLAPPVASSTTGGGAMHGLLRALAVMSGGDGRRGSWARAVEPVQCSRDILLLVALSQDDGVDEHNEARAADVYAFATSLVALAAQLQQRAQHSDLSGSRSSGSAAGQALKTPGAEMEFRLVFDVGALAGGVVGTSSIRFAYYGSAVFQSLFALESGHVEWGCVAISHAFATLLSLRLPLKKLLNGPDCLSQLVVESVAAAASNGTALLPALQLTDDASEEGLTAAARESAQGDDTSPRIRPALFGVVRSALSARRRYWTARLHCDEVTM